MPKMLKKRWAKAICIAVDLEETKAARIPVTVVPMLAPNVIGYMTSSVKTSNPANGVKTEVVIDDDCTKIVIPHPTQIAR